MLLKVSRIMLFPVILSDFIQCFPIHGMNFRRSLPAQILMLNVGQGKSFRKRTRKSFEITHFVTPFPCLL